ncbi:MAG: hypothetical protein FWD44_00100 [Oscillospiraceae bacterium]|nr:hypothetical protein [Oscillospiraceae bacterium]
MMKRIFAFALCIIIVGSVIGTSIATATIQPLWSNLRVLELHTSRSNNTVTSSTTVIGQSGTTRISASYTLEKWENYRYQPVDSWSASSNSASLLNTRTTPNCSAGTYRLRVTVTVTRNGTIETVSDLLVKAL